MSIRTLGPVHLTLRLLLSLTLPLCCCAQSAPAPDLFHLPAEERTSIEAACSAEKTYGPAAYEQCVEKQIDESSRGPGRPDLAALSREERNSIESACYSPRMNEGPAAYNRCLQKLYQEWEHGPRRPNLAALSPQQQTSLESACFRAKMVDGPAAYDQCLATRVEALQSASPPGASSPARPPAERLHKKTPGPGANSSGRKIAAAQAAPIAPGDASPQVQPAAPDQRSSAAQIWLAVASAAIGVLLLVALAILVVGRARSGDQRLLRAKCPQCGRPTLFYGVRCTACKAGPPSPTSHTSDPAASNPFDPFTVLGIRRGATRDEIRAAYRREMANYHPDKVAHLGTEIQQLAEQKAHAINRAYAELVK